MPENREKFVIPIGPQCPALKEPGHFEFTVDGAYMDEPPGAVRWLAWQETSVFSASTHTMPPYVIARYLNAELGCKVVLIGIQPGQTAIGAGLSSSVKQAVDEIVRVLTTALNH